ncbi:cytochrome P450 [Pseudonocardia spinosispora]|uniref:cytochrome P450 n=1 Tax=Pseudonocardia spinosispora TaxID=103441 RepID=UPI00041877BA|nr:cytochrome P450 [Pseudonocardia spinosispora]
MAAGFDPLSEGFLTDPYAALEQVRPLGPVFFSPVLNRWVVTGYAEIEQVLLDPATYSAAEAQRALYPVCPEADAILAGLSLVPTMSNADPPGHARFRSVIVRALSPRRMAKLEPIIRERTSALIDSLLAAGSGGDIVAGLCHPLPAATLFALIGFPAEDGARIKAWCEDKIEVNWGRPSAEQQVRSANSMVAFLGHCRALVGQRRARPADDLTSDLVADERSLTDEEIASLLFALSFAGHETTTSMLGNALLQLLSRPGLWARVGAERALIPGAIEETLRYDTSVPMWRRVSTRESVLGGVVLPEGARLVLCFGAAGREPGRFPDPDRFDVERAEARRQLSFGKGIHLCAGASLARLEGRTVLNELADRMPDLRLSPDRVPRYPANISFRGPRELWVDWGVGRGSHP